MSLLSLLLSFGLFLNTTAVAQPAPTPLATNPPVIAFVRDGCKHCADAEAFFDTWSKDGGPAVTLRNVADPAAKKTFEDLVTLANLPKATPLVFINGFVVQGFDDASTTGKALRELITSQAGKPVITPEQAIATGKVTVSQGGATCSDDPTIPCKAASLLVRIPFTSVTIDAATYSLPVLSGVLGLIDGFNPCAMWVLVTFAIVLIQIGDRRKMWQVAGLFILAETVMYYLILNLWFTAWDFIGLDRIVTPLVGVVALGGGIFFLYEGFMSDGTCKVTNLKQRHQTRLRIQDIATRPFTILTALAVVGLALSVNIIEFACSIGIPQAFTKVLELNHLSFFEQHGLMLIYIIGYMADDFIVFGIALWGVQHLAMTQKYSRITNIIGGLLMLLLGGLLIFHPELLEMM